MWRSGKDKLCHATIRLEQGCHGLISPGSGQAAHVVERRESRPTLADVSVGDLFRAQRNLLNEDRGRDPFVFETSRRRASEAPRAVRFYWTSSAALRASPVLDLILCSLPSASSRKPLDANCLPSLPSSGTFRPGSISPVDRPVLRLLLTTNLLSFCPMAIAPEPWPPWRPWHRLPRPYAVVGENCKVAVPLSS